MNRINVILRSQISGILTDIIQLLPDNIANQIAAGEVIQRPASAVKELLENAVDAGATEVRLIIQDAGKALVQVIDNGKGMSETDARMAFERHATSKISKIDDLFRIRTMGFRGEALASIAAVAQVELKTKRNEDASGTFIEIDNSVVRRQEPVAANEGTSISMKNLFFNVPARRNFLKSNAAELRHIVDEFIRVAMAFPDIFFSLVSNGQEVFHLDKGTLKQRIVQILGNSYASKLVTVQEQTDYLNIGGFVGKPETAKKTRGDQYFFVNNRFIRSAYLNHAVMTAFEDMIPKDSFPMYCLFIDLDPAQLDINVHPTKQEIKFEDEKIVYAFVQSAVKHALAQFSITPTLDFELDPGIQSLDAVSKPLTTEASHTSGNAHLFDSFSKRNQAHFIESKSNLSHWRDVYQKPEDFSIPERPVVSTMTAQAPLVAHKFQTTPIQILGTYILVQEESGYSLIHQQNAHERVLYERFSNAVEGKPLPSQQNLFPALLELAPADYVLLADMLNDLKQLGYELEPFGANCFAIKGTPADLPAGQEKNAIEGLIENVKHFSSDQKIDKREKILRSLAAQHAVKAGKIIAEEEMRELVNTLFACKVPNSTPSGKPTYTVFRKAELDRLFGR